MKAYKRRAHILQLIDENSKVTVEQLIDRFDVSEETIRRDLRQLDESGFVKRVYGGALKVEKMTRFLSFQERLNTNYEKKAAIAKECVDLLEEGDSVFMDGMTTCLILGKMIPPEMNITIVTNSIMIAHDLISRKSQASIHLLGGELDENGMVQGAKVAEELQKYRFDKAIFSCIGVDARGCYFGKMDGRHVPQAQILTDISSELFLLADSTKINHHAFLFGLPLRDFSYLITDEEAPDSFGDEVVASNCTYIKSSYPIEKED